MVPFEAIYRKFEKTNNVCQFCEDYAENNTATRFLLIRSLDKRNLIDILSKYTHETLSGNIEQLTKKVYMSDVTEEQLLGYIESERQIILENREKELEGITEILSGLPVVSFGVRNDKVDDVVKSVVRNKNIKSIEELENVIDSNALPRIRQYIFWSYYNQNANDVIELFFLRHPKIIPTLRKIHNIDFFVKIEDKIIPFDLKFTHISDEYFDLFSGGMVDASANSDIFDDYYCAEDAESELKQIKSFYSSHKHKWALPNYSRLSKIEMIQKLESTGQKRALDFISGLVEKRKEYIRKTENNLKTLEWWNYKFQGERLFCNNNRLFVFIAYKDKLIDGRQLKGKIADIGKKINELLDNISLEGINEIKYHYTKEADLAGDYTALAVSTIYTE